MKLGHWMLPSAAVCAMSCSTKLDFTSNPSDALVIFDGQPIGRTPLTYRAQRGFFGDEAVIRIEKEGYEPIVKTIEQHFDGEYAAIGCGVSCFLILPLVFHLPWAFRYDRHQHFELRPVAGTTGSLPQDGPFMRAKGSLLAGARTAVLDRLGEMGAGAREAASGRPR